MCDAPNLILQAQNLRPTRNDDVKQHPSIMHAVPHLWSNIGIGADNSKSIDLIHTELDCQK